MTDKEWRVIAASFKICEGINEFIRLGLAHNEILDVIKQAMEKARQREE